MRRLFGVTGVLVCVVGLVLLFRHTVLSGDLWVSNGTTTEVEVSVGGSTFRLAPGDNREVGRFSGAQELVTRRRSDGFELDRRTVIFRSQNTHVYNVLGAAPVRLSTIVYSQSNSNTPPRETSMCGNEFLSADVNFVFKAPPRSIQQEKRSGNLLRSVLSLDPGGYLSCLQELNAQPAVAAAFAARLAPAMNTAEASSRLSWMAATLYARDGNAATALALANPLVAADDSVQTHRTFQSVLGLLGREAQTKETYRLRLEGSHAEPDAYLYARLLPSKEALAVLQPFIEGNDLWVHRSLLWHHAVLGEFDAVLKEASWCLEHVDPKDEQRPMCFEQRARALVGMGKASEALAGLEAEYEGRSGFPMEVALLIDRVARKAERKPRFTPFTRLSQASDSGDIYRQFYDLSLGGPPPKDNSSFRGFELLEEARTNPRRALELVDAQPDALRYVHDEVAALLLGEALRTRHDSASRRLYYLLPPNAPLAELQAWVRDGASSIDLSDFDEGPRAALLFARARRLESLGQKEKSDVLYRQVRQTDLLDGLAVHALTDWPAPEAEGVLERVDGLVLPVQ